MLIIDGLELISLIRWGNITNGEQKHMQEIVDTVQNIEHAFVVVQQNMMSMQKSMFGLQKIMVEMQKTMATKEDIAEVRGDITEMKGEIGEMKGGLAAVQEDVEFLKENMATKEDLQETESRVMKNIDGFAQQNQKFDIELVAARSKFDRVEERVEILELKVGIGA